MEVTNVETVFLKGKSGCLRLDTDAGISGYGEPIVETAPEESLRLAERLAQRYLVGEDPLRVEYYRRRMRDSLWYTDGKVANAAIAGLQHALWDIKGKEVDQPVHRLLGGPVHDEVRAYAWIWGKSPEEYAEMARERLDAGYDAVKFVPFTTPAPSYPQIIKDVRGVVEAVRDALGAGADLMIDGAGRWKLHEARRIVDELEEFDPLFVEDMISPYHAAAVEKLADTTGVPYALGDRLTGFGEFEEILQRDGTAVLQPDIAHSGTITELRLIAHAAEHHGMRVAPHNPHGPIATAAAVHVDFTVPNVLIQEVVPPVKYFDPETRSDRTFAEYIDAPSIRIENGRFEPPTEPGLGVQVDDELFECESSPGEFDGRLFDADDHHVPEW